MNQKLQSVLQALEEHGARPGDERRAERAERDGLDAQPDDPLPRPVRHGLQRLELLLGAARRPRLRADQLRDGAARAAAVRQPPDQQRRRPGRDPARQRLPARRPAITTADRDLRRRVPPRPRVRSRGQQPGHRRLRNRPARLREAAELLRPAASPLATEAHTPGDQGTTWTGLTRVPPGETFSRNPVTGPQLPVVPGNN